MLHEENVDKKQMLVLKNYLYAKTLQKQMLILKNYLYNYKDICIEGYDT